MPDAYGTEEMFKLPEVYRPPRVRPAAVPTWRHSKYKGRRISCDICIINIHDGVVDCQLSPATQVVTFGEKKWHLCSFHSAQVKGGERKLK